MTRFIVLIAALIAAVASLEVALLAARAVGPWLHGHMNTGWFVLACNVFVAICLAFVFLRRKKTATKEDNA